MTVTTNPASPYGRIAEGEFDAAPEYAKPKLTAWLEALPGLSDEDFFDKAASAIYESALVGGSRRNFEHEHCKATAAWKEGDRRYRAAGHADTCHGDTLYSRAHAKVMRECGHTPPEPSPCNCGAES